MGKAEDAYKEAQRLIAEARESGADRLSFDLPETHALETLPPEIGALTELRWLNLDNTEVADLLPLIQITELQALLLDNTQVFDLTPLSKITGLQTLDLDNTQVSDLTPLSQIIGLQTLDLDNTQVADLRQIKDHKELIEGAKSDLGLTFHNTAATRYDSTLAQLSEIEDSETRTRETLAYLNTLPPWPGPLPWLVGIDASDGGSAPAAPETQAAKSQIAFLLEHAALTKISAEATASQIRFALRDVPATDGNQLPAILQSYENMAAILEGLANDASNPKQSLTDNALKTRIATLEAEVGKLNSALVDAEKRTETAVALAKANGFWASAKKGAGVAAGTSSIGLVAVGVPTALVYFLGADHPLILAFLTAIGKLPK